MLAISLGGYMRDYIHNVQKYTDTVSNLSPLDPLLVALLLCLITLGFFAFVELTRAEKVFMFIFLAINSLYLFILSI